MNSTTIIRTMQENLDLVQRFYGDWDARPFDASAVASYFDAQYIDHNRPQGDPSFSDAEVIVGLAETLASGFPDGKHTITLIEPVGEDKVLVYWRFAGTHRNMFFNIPASGNGVNFVGTDLLRIQAGQIIEQWHVEELSKMFAQIQTATR